MNLFTLSALATALAAGGASTAYLAGPCGSSQDTSQTVFIINNRPAQAQPSIFELALTSSDPSLKTLAALVAAADLDDNLSGGEFTVFAPTDEAFNELPDGTISTLLNEDGRRTLSGILTYHVVQGAVFADDLPERRIEVKTLAGDTLVVERDGDEVTVNGTPVIAADVRASNGVVHVIGSVLSPDDKPEATHSTSAANQSIGDLLDGADNLSTLRTAVRAAGFNDSVRNGGPYTVLAPTDEAFDALPEGTLNSLLNHSNVDSLRSVLRLHFIGSEATAQQAVAAGEVESRNGAELRFVLEDGQLFVQGPSNRAKVIRTDLDATNGIVHVIDAVLLPN